MEFAGGRYLIAELHFGGRGCLSPRNVTEIYDADTWKVVWRSTSSEITNITISPDGRTMAYARTDGHLELVPFAPPADGAKEGAAWR